MSKSADGQQELTDNSVTRKARALEKRAKARSEGKAPTENVVPITPAATPEKKSRRGVPSPNLVKGMEQQLLLKEQLGLFTIFPLKAGKEFPSLLARLPIFPAIARARQQSLFDKDNALPFKTPFGWGRRHGPPVCVEDEDVLIAVMRLRQKSLTGQGEKLPIPVTSNVGFVDEKGRINVHVVNCTVAQIIEEMGVSDGGINYERVVETLGRLRNVVIELETNKQEKYLGSVTRSGSFKLVDIDMALFAEEGVVLAQFHPIVAKWLQADATYLDWSVRRDLKGRNARALHRFLSSQPKVYKNEMQVIADIVGWEGEKRKLRTQMEAALTQMKDLGWVDNWTIAGTGRKVPYEIEITRK